MPGPCLWSNAVHDRLPGKLTFTLGSFRERERERETRAAGVWRGRGRALLMSLVPLRNVFKQWLNERWVKKNHTHTHTTVCVCACSPLPALRAWPCGHLDFTLLLLPSSPPLLFAFAPVFVTGWVFASAPFIPIPVSASSSVGVLSFFSPFLPQFCLQKNINRDCDRHHPRIARIAGDQESHPSF